MTKIWDAKQQCVYKRVFSFFNGVVKGLEIFIYDIFMGIF
jgi:hypothetical protein